MSNTRDESVAQGAAGFVSYNHDDNKKSRGRVLEILKRICDEYGLITGEDLTLFTDRDIKWGENWRERIDTALQNTTFLIPIATPRFFRSKECRKELLQFHALAKSIGAPELVMPILFVEVEELNDDSQDEAKAIVASTQYDDWTELRLKDPDDPECRARVNSLARRLWEINLAYIARPSVVPQEATPIEEDHDAEDDWLSDDEPGTADMIAAAEAGMPEWALAVEALRAPNEAITLRVTEATRRMQQGEAEGKSFGYRILVARDLAEELMEPAMQLESAGVKYLDKLMALDPGVRAVIAAAGDASLSDKDQKAACQMFTSVRKLIRVSRSSGSSVVELIEAIKVPAKQFKDLRRPLGKMRSGLQSVLDGGAFFDEWERLLDSSPLDCSDTSSGDGPSEAEALET